MLQLFIGLWGKECQKNLPYIFRRSPGEKKKKEDLISYLKKKKQRQFTLFKILLVKIKVILSLIHTNTRRVRHIWNINIHRSTQTYTHLTQSEDQNLTLLKDML